MLSVCSLSVSMSVVFPIPIVFPFRSDKGLTLDMLASESIYGGQFASSTKNRIILLVFSGFNGALFDLAS